MKSGDVPLSPDFVDRKRLLLSLAAAFAIATACFSLTFFLFTWAWFHILTRSEELPSFFLTMARAASRQLMWVIVSLGPLFIMLPAMVYAARKKPPAHAKKILGL